MDTEVIKKAIDSFEADDFINSKELLQKQIHQAKNDFLKAKLELKGDIEDQFVNVEPKLNIKKRVLIRKKAGGE